MKRVLIVGGSGFIGTHLTTRLLALGHHVSIFDKAGSAAHPKLVTRGDVRDAPALAAAVAGHDCIINLAAEHRDDVQPRSRYFEVNVGGAENLVRAAAEHGVQRLIFISTVALYGLDSAGADESAALRPFNPYAHSKAEAEKVYERWVHGAPEHSLLVLRPCVVFGEGNRGNVYNLLERLRRGHNVMVGSGRNRKSVAYVGNLVDFISQHLDAAGGSSEIFNYADPPDMDMRDFVALICRLLRRPPPRWWLPYSLGMAAGYVGDAWSLLTRRPAAISSIRVRKFCADTRVNCARLDATGFVRPYTLEAGLSRMLGNN